MSSSNRVSLILFIGSQDTDQQIKQAEQTFEKLRWNAEILLVNRHGSTSFQNPPDQKTTGRQLTPNVFPNLEKAILAARHPTVAIQDQGVELLPSQWMLLADQADSSTLITAFHSKHSLRGIKRILIWLYSLLVRVLLRIRKNELRPGLTIFRNVSPTELADQLAAFPPLPEDHSPPPNSFELPRLAAVWRLQTRPVSEFDLGIPQEPIRTNSKQILASMGRAVRFWWNSIMFPVCNAPTTLPPESTRGIMANLLLIGIACYLLFSSLGFPLFEPDEARNSQLAMNILESGQWLSLSLGDDHYWDKPPIQIWAIATSYTIFGVSPFATRFPVALVSLATIFFTLTLGKRLVGMRAAWIGAFLLLLTSGFVFASRYATMDASLTAATLVMLLCGYSSLRERFKKGPAVAAGIACGVGLLIKGPVIIVLCGPPLLAAHWLSGKRLNLSLRRWTWFAVPMILIAAPWFLATALVHPDFLSYFFWKHHVLRFSAAFNHRQPFYFYWIGIFLFMFPASYLLPSVTKFMTSRKPENRMCRTREHGFLLLSAIWVILFFSVSESKLPSYIVPAFPFICLLMGVLLERRIFHQAIVDNQQRDAMALPDSNNKRLESAPLDPTTLRPAFMDRLPIRVPMELALCLIAVCAVLLFAFQVNNISKWTMGLTVAIASAIAITAFSIRLRPAYSWACLGIVGFFLVSLSTHELMPALARSRSIHNVAREIQSSAEFNHAPVVFFGRAPYGAGLSLDTSNVFHFDETQTSSMVAFLAKKPVAIIISSTKPMTTLRSDLPWTIKLEKHEGIRHVYLSRPDLDMIARKKSSRLVR